MRTLSVVCARSGSKGLANKCAARINGRMVAEYAVVYSRSLGPEVRTVVSTDIGELAAFCRQNGVAVIERQADLCADDSRIEATLADALERHGADCDLCSLVYGNIPVRYPAMFERAVQVLRDDASYDGVISMQNVEKFNPEWMFDFSEYELPLKRAAHYRRQCLPQMMIHDGHTLLFRAKGFLERFHGAVAYDPEVLYAVFGRRIKPLISRDVVVDIDTVKDLKLASALLGARERQ